MNKIIEKDQEIEQINGIKKSIKKLLYTPQKEESRFAVFESIFKVPTRASKYSVG